MIFVTLAGDTFKIVPDKEIVTRLLDTPWLLNHAAKITESPEFELNSIKLKIGMSNKRTFKYKALTLNPMLEDIAKKLLKAVHKPAGKIVDSDIERLISFIMSGNKDDLKPKIELEEDK